MRIERRFHGLLFVVAMLTGCPDDSGSGTNDQPQDLAFQDLACIENPHTHIEILNACTSAQSIDKKPVLPLLHADGTLPPLP